MFSAFFLFVVEADIFNTALNRQLDTLDGLTESEVQHELVDSFADGAPDESRPPQDLIETAGIATGVSADLAKQIALRRLKQRKTAPNNLARPPVC